MPPKQKAGSKQAERRATHREQRRERNQSRKRFRRILYLSASGVIALLIIASFVFSSLPKGTAGINTGTKQVKYLTGVGTQQPLMATAKHVDGTTVTYNTVPPTSGDHWSTPTQCGNYASELRDEIIVHNLEHGNIVISYNLTDTAAITKLTSFASTLNDSKDWLVVRPYSKLQPGEVAIVAWGVMDKFTGVDENRIKTFYNTYFGNLFSQESIGNGQGIPCSSNPKLGK